MLTALKRLRLEKGIKQIDLAEMVGIDHTVLCRYENGRRKDMPDDLAAKLATALGTSPEAIQGKQ
jgi:transcriptional regulator with XRE-family HTH domain